MKKLSILITLCILSTTVASAQNDTIPDDFDVELDEVVIRSKGSQKLNYGATNSELLTAVELTRAACCSLAESFTTNPSVDVNYSDAVTGAKQIKLLGLSGSYVQTLTENVPNIRGVAGNFGLDYIPGSWIQSIQISKGASSVKNGFESITGQINVELLKPQMPSSALVNLYGDTDGRVELNAAGNLNLKKRWNGSLMLHLSNSFATHDGDDDGFVDMPKVRRLALANRWAYMGNNYIFQLSVKGLLERRKSGQLSAHAHYEYTPYIIDIDSKRLEAFAKNAYIIDSENDANVALILSGSVQDIASDFGVKYYNALQYEGYASLMFERKWLGVHSLSAGASLQYDNFRQHFLLLPTPGATPVRDYTHEAVTGIYGQYTYNDDDDRLIMMGGLRYDYSSLYGSFVTPRLHFRLNPKDFISLHASAGIGYRSPHPMAEFNPLLASSRIFELPDKMRMEKAVNAGGGFSFSFPNIDRDITISADYYYTGFFHQLTADLNEAHRVVIGCDSKGYSHAVQLELLVSPIDDMTITGAYRYTDVKVNYGHGYRQKPLTSPHRGFLSVGYNPFMGKWQFDVTLSVNSGGVMPTPYRMSDGELSWGETFPTHCRLNAQITRNFRKWSVYIGAENLTNYRQKNPIIGAADPWGPDFDATMVWGSLSGIMGYVGFRLNLNP